MTRSITVPVSILRTLATATAAVAAIASAVVKLISRSVIAARWRGGCTAVRPRVTWTARPPLRNVWQSGGMSPSLASSRAKDSVGHSIWKCPADRSYLLGQSAIAGQVVLLMNGIGGLRDCLFCQVLSVAPQDLRWHDRPLTRVPGVGAVIPGLGAFVPGYVLVFPEQHVESTLRVSRDRCAEFNDLLRRTADLVATSFGPVTVFEHGSCSRLDQRRSACLDHAHTHILPGVYALSSAIVDPHYYPRNSIPGPLGTDLGYLLLDEPPHGPRYGADPGVSQYLRRCIAAKLDMPDEWDYLLFPRLDNVRETVKRYRARSR